MVCLDINVICKVVISPKESGVSF